MEFIGGNFLSNAVNKKLTTSCFQHDKSEKQYLWRDPVFVDIFGAEFFPPQYTIQSRLLGLDGVGRSLDLILRVRAENCELFLCT